MADYRVFDAVGTPLEGANLIEASAGTGKTHTITGLFLRLLLEKNLAVHQILVVTFTEAATEELKERIRNKIHEAIDAFSKGESEDSLLAELVKKQAPSEGALRLLREALRAFDEAPIFTIHGFCRRMLHENAFESGSLFDTELVTDPSVMIQESVDDFWRRHLYTASSLFANFALTKRFTPAELAKLLKRKVNQPFLRIIPDAEGPDTGPQEKKFREAFARALKAWQSSKEEVIRLLTSWGGLNRSKYRASKIDPWGKEMELFFTFGESAAGLFPAFSKFCRSEVAESMNKGFSPPKHPFFDRCEDLYQASRELEEVFARRLLGLKVKLFREVDEELGRIKIEKNVQTFEDLLLKLQAALEGRGGRDLATAIRRKYRAALIDEFQDTDPVQYSIFRSIFGGGGSILFLVGDPKQSIYGFRGADIFAYMEAVDKVDERYTLTENWRSDPELIQSVNALFGNVKPAFVYEKIPFEPAKAARGEVTKPLEIEGKKEPFTLWFVDAEKWAGQNGVIDKKVAKAYLPGLVAEEITRLLNLGKKRKALIGGNPLKANDIAVLVRQNDEALLVQDALSERNVPSVLHSTQSVFKTHEAREMERFLAAAVEPNAESLIKAALSTDMIGMAGEELEQLTLDISGRERWLVKFRDYRDLWQDRGFFRMFRSFLRDEKVLNRLIAFENGERRNTNLLHLMEVLHQASVQRKLNMTGLLKWLLEQRDREDPGSEEHQLRLESDENAVRLVTIHKSKGLEYPVVFCPFSWDGVREKRPPKPVLFHNPQNRMELIFDLGSDERESHQAIADKEDLAENLRLLYVALTRAKCRVYLVWGRFKGAETSAPAYLLHAPQREGSDSLVEALAENFKKQVSDKDLLSTALSVMKKAAARVQVIKDLEANESRFSPLPEEVKIQRPKGFAGTIDRQWRISSFSALVSDKVHGEEGTDYDAATSVGPEDPLRMIEEPAGIFAFPKGAKAGTFLHDVFEHLDFCSAVGPSREDLVKEKLAQYGYDLSWLEIVCGMLDKVLRVPLDPGRQDFCLSRVRMEERLNELGFYFPLKALPPETLRRILAGGDLRQEVPERIERLNFSPLRGFMKGFVDMVFRFEDRYYLVDWKSNFLGASVEDYALENLTRAMEENLYTLQYTFYTLALNQYLRVRVQGYDYDRHFGGVYYVFLRGVDPGRGPGFGVYRDKPRRELIEALSKELIGLG
jgi:exodeoxyribonuclease V beta subunit